MPAAALAAFRIPAALLAQLDYPTKPIRLIVPSTACSTADISARAIAQKITVPLSQPVIIEIRPGANGSVGMQAVARAEPDGYTLVVGSVSSRVVPSVISRVVQFDLLRDSKPVSVIASTTLLMMVAKDSPYNSVSEPVSAAKRRRGR